MGPVVVVEDDADSMDVLELVLDDAGIEWTAIRDGEEALAWLARGEPAAAVVLDLWLPGASGAEVLAAVRRDRGWGTPVLVITAAPVPPEVARDADAVFEKPFDVDDFLETLTRVLARPHDGGGEAARPA